MINNNNMNNCPIYPCWIARLGSVDCNNIWDCTSCKMMEKQKIKDLIRRFAFLIIESDSRGERTP
jgi:Zn-finger protein